MDEKWWQCQYRDEGEIVAKKERVKYILFADDTIILCSRKEIENIENTVNFQMFKIHRWLFTNGISINLSKLTIWFELI